MFDFYYFCAVIHLVCDVGRLLADISYLADKRHLCDNFAIDLELSVRVRMKGVKYLLDGDRSDGVLAVTFAGSGAALNLAANPATAIRRTLRSVACIVIVVAVIWKLLAGPQQVVP